MTQLLRLIGLAALSGAHAFMQPNPWGVKVEVMESATSAPSKKITSLNMSSFDEDFLQETPDQTRERIQDLVDANPVLLFMKGSKLFPQCGFSSTAVQILNTFGIDFHSGKRS